MSQYQANIIIKNPATPTGPNANGSAPGIWRMNEVAYWIKQGVWPNANILPDTYFPYVSLLLSSTSLGNANNNLFVDSSGAFNPISRNGNTTQGSATPYSANWSNYFDGSGDYLETPSNAAFDLGGGDFTVEGWYYWNGTGTYPHFFQFGSNVSTRWNVYRDGGGGGYFRLFSSTGVTTTTAVPSNTWFHLAVTKSGSTTRLFFNGTQIGSNTGVTYYSGNMSVAIGTQPYSPLADDFFAGYASNFRVVKGTALYTSNFTPSTTPLTAISGTSLLTCQSNRFRDASSNNFTITRNGDTRVTDFAPFSPGSPGITYNQSDITNWSGYFDGSGDYLAVPSTSALPTANQAYTIEAWIYPTTINTDNGVIGWGTYGTTNAVNAIKITSTQIFNYWWANDLAGNFTFTAGQWYHIVAQFDGTTRSLYVNGTRLATDTPTGHNVPSPVTNATIGVTNSTEYFTGSISNVRVITGQAIYSGASFTVPTSPLTAISGTSLLTLQNAAFTDNSTNNFILTPNGNVTVTGNSPFNTVGYWSNYFDGSSTFSFSSISLAADFTIEAWVYYTSTSGNPTLLGENPPNNQSLRRLSGKHYFYRQGASITGTIDIPTNQWVHLAATRSGGTVRIFTNGVLDGSGSISGAFSVNCFGGVDTGTDRLTGYASNVRIVDGTALYTATFTVPTSPLTAVSGTTLLTAQNGTFKDNSTNNRTLTRNGSPTVQSFDPFYTATTASNGGSMYFDGSGDYLRSTITPLNIRTAFTIDSWVYLTTITNFVFFSASTTAGSAGAALYLNEGGGTMYFGDGVANNITFASSSVPTNAWTHIACTFDGTTYRVFINGTSVGSSTTLLSNFTLNGIDIGARLSGVTNYTTGYMSGFRITGGTALYTASFTPPTAPVTPTANTTLLLNGMNAGIYDATAINDMETVGNAQVSTVQSKFGGSSVYFDGNGDYLHFPYPVEFFTPTSWTLEGWVYINSLASAVGIFGYSDLLITRITSTAIRIEYRNNPSSPVWMTNESSYTFSTGTWYHIAFVLNNGSFRTYVDGTAVGSASTGVGAGAKGGTGPQKLIIGATDQSPFDSVDTFLNGYMDDVRITSGVARYTTNFTPPTQPFPTF